MRFSALLSTALLVGFVTAAPTKDSSNSSPSYDSSNYSSSSSYDSSNNNYGSNSNNYGSSSSSSSSAYDSKSTDKSSKSSSSSSSGYDSSNNNNYGSSSSSSAYDSKSTDNSNSKDNSKSTMMSDSSSSMKDSSKTTSSEMMDSTSTSMYYQSTYSTSSAMATSTMSYGSGSTNWGNSGYNDCVQQCIASYGAPPATWTPSSTQSSSSDGSYSGSTGTGATHTVIVAPTQGVLRFVPFAVNASVGDTVMFVWNAKNHTVTKSSALEICNKTSDAPFASGEHDAPFTFTQVVNDTNPTFFYCGTPGHCQKGMFGIINPPSAYMTSTSIAQTMGSAVSNSSDMAAMMAYTNSLTSGNDKAANWGQNIDLATLPDWSHSLVMENVMYTRSFLGANPETLKDDGSIDLSGDAPKMIPTDMAPVNAAVDNAASSSAPAASSAPASASSSAAASPTGAAAGKSNGAASTAASSALLSVAAIAAAVLVL
ncbi:hypothetical protein GSI_13668 [Ganoderma sinense ZZ0214-1]|uniref:Phytocyanin domain-containing protein n=1 Tax=Ganoderma sinense ZZ0214-1 TaxID=1077348 RepID=A0A2G8RQY5_9APHY|nr:hypothetical protein GSI_13668 [Ganoderma sinense ZZ0214-1]